MVLTSCAPSVSELRAEPHIERLGLHDQEAASPAACLPAAQWHCNKQYQWKENIYLAVIQAHFSSWMLNG